MFVPFPVYIYWNDVNSNYSWWNLLILIFQLVNVVVNRMFEPNPSIRVLWNWHESKGVGGFQTEYIVTSPNYRNDIYVLDYFIVSWLFSIVNIVKRMVIYEESYFIVILSLICSFTFSPNFHLIEGKKALETCIKRVSKK